MVPLAVLAIDWQAQPHHLDLYHLFGRYVITAWLCTMLLADMSLQCGFIQRYWQVRHYNLALYNVIGRYVTTTWPIPSSLYVLPCCLRFTVANNFSELCGKVRAAAAATVADVSTCLVCKHDIYRDNYCSFSEYL